MFKEIEDTVYPEGGYIWDPDLKRWSNQGILLINSALTTTIGKVGKHYDLWQPFIAFLLDILGAHKPGLVYVMMGKVARGWSILISDDNHKLTCPHPASAAHNLKETWDSGDIFGQISNLMWLHYKYKMIW